MKVIYPRSRHRRCCHASLPGAMAVALSIAVDLLATMLGGVVALAAHGGKTAVHATANTAP